MLAALRQNCSIVKTLCTVLQVERLYHAIVLGMPKEAEGEVQTNIGRDVRDRKKMGVFPYMSSRFDVSLVTSLAKGLCFGVY
jgi:23S rRNA-/tRNA-specific pseudouridylate synthase